MLVFLKGYESIYVMKLTLLQFKKVLLSWHPETIQLVETINIARQLNIISKLIFIIFLSHASQFGIGRYSCSLDYK